jgi:hypothetical protein
MNKEIKEYLLKKMNQRRVNRINARGCKKGNRGASVQQNFENYIKDRTRYKNKFKSEWTLSDLDCFLSCFLRIMYLGIRGRSISIFWESPEKKRKRESNNDVGITRFFKARISKEKFSEMLRCVDFESEEFFKMVQENILREWKNSNKFGHHSRVYNRSFCRVLYIYSTRRICA